MIDLHHLVMSDIKSSHTREASVKYPTPDRKVTRSHAFVGTISCGLKNWIACSTISLLQVQWLRTYHGFHNLPCSAKNHCTTISVKWTIWKIAWYFVKQQSSRRLQGQGRREWRPWVRDNKLFESYWTRILRSEEVRSDLRITQYMW